MSKDWFEVHRKGLAQVLERRGKAFAVLELIANPWDEIGVTKVDITLASIPGQRGLAVLCITDDAPDGFADLADAWTLFAPSKKKGNAEQRGRFNLGEKLVLALCTEAEIVSTRGGVRFDSEGRHSMRTKREFGSVFSANIRLTQAEVAEVRDAVFSLIPPAGITTTYNGEEIPHRTSVHTFRAALATELADDEGYIRPTRRTTSVMVYEPLPGETPSLYEMGIPVVETGDKWHIDIAQKVPLNTERDNVRPAFLREVRTLVTNEMFRQLTQEDATHTWVQEALSDRNVDPAAVEHTMTLLYGEKRVVYDPSDAEANKIAVSKGYRVIHGGAFSKPQWDNIRAASAALPAGQVTPSPKVVMSPNGKPPIAREDWTPQMERLAHYAEKLSTALLGFPPYVRFWNIPDAHWAAMWGKRGNLGFNVGTLGKRWMAELNQQEVDELLLHEFAHEKVPAHLAAEFGDEVARLGAKLRTIQIFLNEHELTEADERLIEDIGASHGH